MSSKQSSTSRKTNHKNNPCQTNMSSSIGNSAIDPHVVSTDAPTSTCTPTKPTKRESRNRSSYSTKNKKPKRKRSEYEIYCDLDGVLVDFEAGVERLFQKPSSSLNSRVLWSGIARDNKFYETLPWTSDGQELWHALVHDYEGTPNILTGVPMKKTSREEKYRWCERELETPFGGDGEKVKFSHVDMAGTKRRHECVKGERGEGVINVITCWSKNKHYESRAGA